MFSPWNLPLDPESDLLSARGKFINLWGLTKTGDMFDFGKQRYHAYPAHRWGDWGLVAPPLGRVDTLTYTHHIIQLCCFKSELICIL